MEKFPKRVRKETPWNCTNAMEGIGCLVRQEYSVGNPKKNMDRGISIPLFTKDGST
jgi:hypothetical protein